MAKQSFRVPPRHSRCALILASLIASSLAGAQAADAPPSPGAPAAPSAAPAGARVPLTRETATARRTSFEQGWPMVEANLKRWQQLDESPRDFRSVAPAYDLKNYVFTKENRKALDTRRSEAQAQFDGGDWPGAILLYGTLIEQANGVVARLAETGGYWIWYVNHDRRMNRWRKAVRSNDLPNPKGAELDSLESRLKEQIRSNEFGSPSKTLMLSMDQLFKQALAEARAAAPGGVLRDDPLRRMPRESCVDGQPDMTLSPGVVPRSAPRLDVRRSKSTNNFYPPVARFYGVQGVVTVRAMTSPSGCVVYAEVAKSSGSDLLDDAAMDWAVEAASFSPALDTEGRPMPASFQFNVRFKFND